MNKKTPTISIAIVTHNEAENISECLKSVSWADEIIIVDGQSTDETVKIAKKSKAKIYVVDNQPLMKINMNLSFQKCTSDWILSLDADERISASLKDEILSMVSVESENMAYQIPRKNIIFGKWIEHTGWYPDYQIRLFKNGKGRFPAKNVHELLSVDGKMGSLSEPLDHLHYKNLTEFLRKLDGYTSAESQKIINDGGSVSWYDALNYPKEEFLSRFFLREGYKDGLHGLVLSLLQAFYWEVVFAKIWEHQGFESYNSSSFLIDINKRFKSIVQDWNYWMMESTIDKSSKFKLKVKNKISKFF